MQPSAASSILASVAHGETNPASIAVPLIGTSGVAASYPSTIEVDAPGGPGQTRFVWVTLHNVTDPCPEDLAVLLVHNETAKYLLMANAGGCRPFQGTTIRFVSDWFDPRRYFGMTMSGSQGANTGTERFAMTASTHDSSSR